MKTIEIRRSDGAVLCTAWVADNLVTRGVGLLGRRSLHKDEGMLIDPCKSLHTFFMRFPIDVIYLDENNKVVKTLRMGKFQFSIGGSRAKKVLELSAGSIATLDLRLGESLTLVSDTPAPQ